MVRFGLFLPLLLLLLLTFVKTFVMGATSKIIICISENVYFESEINLIDFSNFKTQTCQILIFYLLFLKSIYNRYLTILHTLQHYFREYPNHLISFKHFVMVLIERRSCPNRTMNQNNFQRLLKHAVVVKYYLFG